MNLDFGWHYPPGTENDPHAPWNEPEGEDYCECGEAAIGNGMCKACNHAEALLARWERRRDEP